MFASSLPDGGVPSAGTRPAPTIEWVTVSRRVDRPPSRVGSMLSHPATTNRLRSVELASRGRLELGPFAPVPGAARGWRAAGRLVVRGPRLVRHARISVSVTAWTSGACEVRLEPFARRPLTWGARRQRRYFGLAHDAADLLWRILSADPEVSALMHPTDSTMVDAA